MKAETLMVLLNFSPKNIKRTHPFWRKIFETGVNIEQKNVKFKEWEGKFKYFKGNWRYHKNIIIDFYSYLRLNFPNQIPFFLFFPYATTEYGNKDYNEYREEEFVDKNEKYLDDEKPEELQFDDSIYYPEYNNKNDDNCQYDDYRYFDFDGDIEEIKTMVNLADKWLSDILSGESFYKNNKDYFTRTETKYFLTCDWVEPDIRLFSQSGHMDLILYYWKTKIKANELELSPNFFANKFNSDSSLKDRYVQDFFRFVCLNKRYVRDENEISDVWDYLIARDGERHRDEFDFDRMTWQQLRHMSEEWHGQRNNEQYISKKMKNKVWKKSIIKDFTHVNEKIWTITEITTGKLLYEEGYDMHNCVFDYITECISGYSAVFSVKANDRRVATLELKILNSDYEIVQARGKMNMSITDNEIKTIIVIWAKENHIKFNDYVFDS
jgi:hypothetical protein